MVKCTLAFGLLAATLAVSVKAHRSGVEVFTPALNSEPKFNVYKDAVAVAVPAEPASFVAASKKPDSVKDKAKIATAYLNKHHNIPVENIKVTDAYTDKATGLTHVYVKQV
ncbi:hypothetical protein GGI12_004843, partial [Dipsacomyces acuminosporus]